MSVQAQSFDAFDAEVRKWIDQNQEGIKERDGLKANQTYIPKLEISKRNREVSCEKIPVKATTIFGAPKEKPICLDNLKAIVNTYVRNEKPVPEFLLRQIQNYNKNRIFNRIDENKVNKNQAQYLLNEPKARAEDLETFVWTTKLKGISKDVGHELLEKAKELGTVNESIMNLIAKKCSKAEQKGFKAFLAEREQTIASLTGMRPAPHKKIMDDFAKEGTDLLEKHTPPNILKKIGAVQAKAMQSPQPEYMPPPPPVRVEGGDEADKAFEGAPPPPPPPPKSQTAPSVSAQPAVQKKPTKAKVQQASPEDVGDAMKQTPRYVKRLVADKDIEKLNKEIKLKEYLGNQKVSPDDKANMLLMVVQEGSKSGKDAIMKSIIKKWPREDLDKVPVPSEPGKGWRAEDIQALAKLKAELDTAAAKLAEQAKPAGTAT